MKGNSTHFHQSW